MAEPPSSIQTIRGAGPGPVREGALARLVALIDHPEGREKGGKNWGPPVERFCRPFLSEKRYQSYAPGGERAGKLQWCAFSVCGTILEELEARGMGELAKQWRKIAAGLCSEFHAHLDAHGWAWSPGDPLPPALCPPGQDPAPAVLVPGDIVFYGEEILGEDHFAHVDFYERPVEEVKVEGGTLLLPYDSVGGNTGWPLSDRVDRCKHYTPEKLARVLRVARVPW